MFLQQNLFPFFRKRREVEPREENEEMLKLVTEKNRKWPTFAGELASIFFSRKEREIMWSFEQLRRFREVGEMQVVFCFEN